MLGKVVKNVFFSKSAPAAGVPPADSSASGHRRGSLAPSGLARYSGLRSSRHYQMRILKSLLMGAKVLSEGKVLPWKSPDFQAKPCPDFLPWQIGHPEERS